MRKRQLDCLSSDANKPRPLHWGFSFRSRRSLSRQVIRAKHLPLTSSLCRQVLHDKPIAPTSRKSCTTCNLGTAVRRITTKPTTNSSVRVGVSYHSTPSHVEAARPER